MQLCSLIFGNKPTVSITYPANGATISGSSLTVTGTIEDLDGDQTKVKVWIEDTSISGWDSSVDSGSFSVTLTLTGLSNGQHYLIAQGYDINNNTSDKVTISITYSSDGSTGHSPILSITSPQQNFTAETSTIQLVGTVTDEDGDASVGVTSIRNTSGQTVLTFPPVNFGPTDYYAFNTELDISSLSPGVYTIVAWAEDQARNKSDEVQILFTYSPGYANLLQNGNFSDPDYVDSNIIYDSVDKIDLLNNQSSGDYLPDWEFYIWSDYALDNLIKIDLDGYSVRYYSNENDSDGNAKMYIRQTFEYTITDKTKFYIKFKINSYSGGTYPAEGPLKICFNGTTVLFASYSTGGGTDNPPYIESNLNTGEVYEREFYLKDAPYLCPGYSIDSIYIFVNCWYWDVTIYEIRIWEEE